MFKVVKVRNGRRSSIRKYGKYTLEYSPDKNTVSPFPMFAFDSLLNAFDFYLGLLKDAEFEIWQVKGKVVTGPDFALAHPNLTNTIEQFWQGVAGFETRDLPKGTVFVQNLSLVERMRTDMYQIIRLEPETDDNPIRGNKYVIHEGQYYHRILVALVEDETDAQNRVDTLKRAGHEAYWTRE